MILLKINILQRLEVFYSGVNSDMFSFINRYAKIASKRHKILSHFASASKDTATPNLGEPNICTSTSDDETEIQSNAVSASLSASNSAASNSTVSNSAASRSTNTTDTRFDGFENAVLPQKWYICVSQMDETAFITITIQILHKNCTKMCNSNNLEELKKNNKKQNIELLEQCAKKQLPL